MAIVNHEGERHGALLSFSPYRHWEENVGIAARGTRKISMLEKRDIAVRLLADDFQKPERIKPG